MGWIVFSPVLFASIHPNKKSIDYFQSVRILLQVLCYSSGGKFFNLPQVGGLADAIIRDTGGVVTHVELGTEKSWKLYIAIVVLFTLEWALRRRIFVV